MILKNGQSILLFELFTWLNACPKQK